MSSDQTDSQPPLEPWYLRYQLVFRDYDQIAVVVTLVASVLVMTVYLGYRSYRHRQFIDIDRLPKRELKYQIDINSADWPEIANLPGIGPKLARAIVAHRAEFGDFSTAEALDDVAGIGPAKLDRLKKFLAPIEPAANE